MQNAIQQVSNTFALEKMNLENENLKTDIALKRAQLGPSFPTQDEARNQLAHLSRSPQRTLSGNPIGDKNSEQELEKPHESKYIHFYGNKLETPPQHSPGEMWDNLLGDDLTTKLVNLPPFIHHNLYRSYPSYKNWWDNRGTSPFKRYSKPSFKERFHY